MRKPTERQLEVLKVLNPYLGNISYVEAAEGLGVSEASVKEIMQSLKKRCPGVYERFWNLRKKLNRGQRDIDLASTIDPTTLTDSNIKKRW